MPFFETAAGFHFPSQVWSPEAMLTWVYDRCLRTFSNGEKEERRTLYQQRLAVLREVMQTCRSSDPDARFAASSMMPSMQDLSQDENSPLNQMSRTEISHEMDRAEHAFNVGSRLEPDNPMEALTSMLADQLLGM